MDGDANPIRWPRWTVRGRLMAGLMGLLVVLIAGVGVTEALVLRHFLYVRSASGLRTELALLAAGSVPTPAAGPGAGDTTACSGLGVVPQVPVPLPPGPAGQPKGRTLGRAGAHDLAQVLAQRGVASAVVDANGAVLACARAASNGSQSGFRVPAAAVDALTRRDASGGYVTLRARDHNLLAIAQPVGADTAILVTDLASDDAAVGTVIDVTVIGGLVALAVAALASRPLLRSALTPLSQVAATADAIAAGSLDQRADLQQRTDEVGRLGVAFDRMVDRLHASLAEREVLVGRLQVSEEAMRRLLADASHELRTPLTAIRGGAQVLRLGAAADPADLAEGLGHIEAQAERMSRLVADLLLLSRQDGRVPERPRKRIDLGELVSGERRNLIAVGAGHPVQLDTTPAWVRADPDSVVRLLANLVDNAAKYSPAGSPLQVVVAAGEDGAELVVTDHGPGIPASERELVFTRFYRGDPARARATGGIGLGLAIVAAIAADHGGTARAEEAAGGGTRIVVTLPLAAAPHPPRSASATAGDRQVP